MIGNKLVSGVDTGFVTMPGKVSSVGPFFFKIDFSGFGAGGMGGIAGLKSSESFR